MLLIERLSVAYGETLILRDVDLQVQPGEVVCLMGRNGVGKTTLLKSLMGLLRPRAGRILFGNEDLTRTSPDHRARCGIGYVPQGREIFPHLTVLENLQIGLFANRSLPPAARTSMPSRAEFGDNILDYFPKVKTMFRLFGLFSDHSLPYQVPDRVFDYFPMLKTMLHRKGGVLSGGQQQQLAIARALVSNPRLLILDEPTEGIQPSIISLIGKVLAALKQEGKVSVLLVEQYFEFALKLADSCYVMEKGAIVMHNRAADIDKEAIKPYLAF